MFGANKNIISDTELNILQFLETNLGSTVDRNTIEIAQISQSTGIKDNDEVLRALYSLEGKSLVEPNPPGDFTSNHWRITNVGSKALDMIEE